MACEDTAPDTKIKTERLLKPVCTVCGKELGFVGMRKIENNLSNTSHGWDLGRMLPKYSKDIVITAVQLATYEVLPD